MKKQSNSRSFIEYFDDKKTEYPQLIDILQKRVTEYIGPWKGEGPHPGYELKLETSNLIVLPPTPEYPQGGMVQHIVVTQ